MIDRPSVRPTRPSARAARAALTGLVVAGCAVVAHAGAGGAVEPLAVPSVAAPAGVVAWSLAAHRLRTSQLVGLLLLGQTGLHVTSAGHSAGGWGMVAAHAAATLVSLLLVRRGEDAWWRLADLVTAGFRPRTAAVAPPVVAAASSTHARWWPHGLLASGSLGGRAPPVGR